MPKFFFDVSDGGEVYHDARGVILPNEDSAKLRGCEIVTRLVVGTHHPKDESRELLCTIRDMAGRPMMKIRVESGAPVVSEETESPSAEE
ncbi:hypothetical protein [Mesorhizobium sp. WSM3860]|uniref:DUF6894 family protein n=1 Tax=Mesorhizobium sp. WSM3860 TaxID=2029403 RepID=UPI000BAF788B|nr:hypothetical protein [Mesorhizobium sp. WSM3860]PBC02663.1 hypothetical protein CK220_19530 [Mesorhizobium sp. WSM3860]